MGTVKNLNNFPCHYRPRRDEISSQLNVIDPKIGGVMIMGDRGTGKSTTIRALADLLQISPLLK
jgi:Mg-chelatase subunit ChlI